MPTTIRETVLAAVATKLDAISGTNFKRTATPPVDYDDLPAIRQYSGNHVPVPQNTGSELRTMRVDVEIYVTAATDDELDPALNDLYGKVYSALIDPVDPTHGVPAVRHVRKALYDNPDILSEDQARSFYGTLLGFEINFETAESDPYNAG